MRCVIAGSRYKEKRMDGAVIKHVLDKLHHKHEITVVLSGRCPNSPDMDGEDWANANQIPIEPYAADWDKHGKGAGHIRNSEMAKNADMLVAFWDGVSKGTLNMIAAALKKPHAWIYVIHFDGKLEKYKEGVQC